jgi:predicted transcriptional regulator
LGLDSEHPTETLQRDENAVEIALSAVAGKVLAERLLSVRDVAERLGICRAAVYAMVDRKDLPHMRIDEYSRNIMTEAHVARGG